MAIVALKRYHHVIAVLSVLETQHIIGLQQIVINDRVVQISRHQYGELIFSALLVAGSMPRSVTFSVTHSVDTKIYAYDAALTVYLPIAPGASHFPIQPHLVIFLPSRVFYSMKVQQKQLLVVQALTNSTHMILL